MPDLLEHKDLIERFLKKSKCHLSAFSFVNLFIWQDFFEFDVKEIEGKLCVFASDLSGTFLYWPPLGGELREASIKECFRIMQQKNKNTEVSRIECVLPELLMKFPAENFVCRPRAYEYCYRRKDLAELKGNALKSQRSSYNHFLKNYCHEYLPFHLNMREDCLSLYSDWAQNRQERYGQEDVYRYMLEDNYKVHERAMRFYKELGLIGRVVITDGKVRAYTFGYPLNEDVFCVLFEITQLDVKGLANFIFSKFCQDEALKDYSFINAMDDFSMDNVGAVKRSFQPVILLSSYTVAMKK